MNITLPPDFLEADGNFDDESPAETRLSNREPLIINGGYFHLEAIQVEREDSQIAVNPSLQDFLDHLCEINGAPCQTQKINGRHYITAIFPHGL